MSYFFWRGNFCWVIGGIQIIFCLGVCTAYKPILYCVRLFYIMLTTHCNGGCILRTPIFGCPVLGVLHHGAIPPLNKSNLFLFVVHLSVVPQSKSLWYVSVHRSMYTYHRFIMMYALSNGKNGTIRITTTAFIYFDEKMMWRIAGFEEMLVSPAKRDQNEMGGLQKRDRFWCASCLRTKRDQNDTTHDGKVPKPEKRD